MEEVTPSRILPMSQEPHRHLDRKSQITLPAPDLSNVSTTPKALPFWPSPHVQSPSSPGTAVSSLQSKVKALSQSRVGKKGWDYRNPASLVVGPSQTQQFKRGRDKKVSTVHSPSVNPAAEKRSSSSDDEFEPQYQVQTYLTDPLQMQGDEQEEEESSTLSAMGICALSRGPGEGASLEDLFDDICRFQEDEPPSVNPWTPPDGLWKTAHPETILLNGSTQLRDEPSGRPNVGAGNQKNTRLVVEQGRNWEQQQTRDSVMNHPWRHLQKETGSLGSHGGLWRADSWDSVCSSSSSVSLAERVEINRGILKHMLNKAWQKDVKETGALESEKSSSSQEMRQGNGRGLISVIDSDWDSGISLQESEHTHSRSLVSGDEQALSPRLQQAKLLLERARAKTRRCPLKGDHSILPLQRSCTEVGGNAVHQTPLLGRERPAPGNLSDSSSDDSNRVPRLRRGASPTRVRFQDESEKDAEVRYLERQWRRTADRAQDLLLNKPGFSSYTHSAEDCSLVGDTSARSKTEGIHNGGITKNGDRSQEARKCHSCGTVLDALQELRSNLPTSTERKVLPCWVAPSHPNPANPTEINQHSSSGKVTFACELDFGGTQTECVARPWEIVSAHRMLKEKERNDQKLETGLQVQPQPSSNGTEVSKICESSGSALSQRGMEIVRAPTPYFKEQFSQSVNVSSFHSTPSIASGTLTASSADGSVQPQPMVTPTPPQPRKSALSHSPRTRSPGQRVKILPSLQYRLIHLDNEDSFSSSDAEHHREDSDNRHTKLGFMEDSPSPTDSVSLGVPIGESTSAWMYSTCHDHPDQRLCRRSARAPETRGLGLSQGSNGELCPNGAGDNPAPGHSAEPFRTSPTGLELVSEDSVRPAQLLPASSHQRGGKPKLSLRQFFSAITFSGAGTMGKGRSSSMEHLSCSPKPSCASPGAAHKQRSRLKKAPSLQSLHLGSPLAHLQKASSVQSLLSPKKKHDRSSSYAPGDHPSIPAHSGLHRALSVDDVGSPSGGRSVGRVTQAFPDGTLLLELTRPPQGPFGFLISRGKGRSDSGVYVEEISDSSTQKIYAGLLGVGDEILEVNGEKVAGLNLEQVTWLMTRDNTASIRVLRHRQKQS